MMKTLPERANEQLDAIRTKLLDCLAAGAKEQQSARSHFMKYGESVGGPMLDSEPEVAHDYHDLLTMYEVLYDRAKADGVGLRDVATQFTRTPGAPWAYETRWLTVDQYDAFLESVQPTVEEIRTTLRGLVQSKASEWEFISFSHDQQRVLIHTEDGERIIFEPTPGLTRLVERIAAIAHAQGLKLTGGSWDVESDMEDTEGEIDSAFGVI